MNTICVYGRLTTDVTTKDVNGRMIANFRMAANNKRKQQDGSYGSNFYSVSVFGPTAENVAKYLCKRSRATVSGQLVIREYTGNDGLKHQVVEIDADNVDFVDTKAEAQAMAAKVANTAAPASAPAQATPQIDTDEMPF